MTAIRYSALTALLIAFLLSPTGYTYGQQYVLVGWNDLGMHCANQDFSKVTVLPPFNNVYAQLIENDSSGLPRLVTTGFTIEYSIPGNTTSAGKTNFWTYAQQLFGLGSPLPQDVGLTGNGLTGKMAIVGTHFTASGIPVTPYQDSNLVHENPFQLIHLVARRNADSVVVATTDAVIPVSNEVGCVQSGCHSSATAILDSHNDVPGFNRSGPVLCASCHASNALGTAGTAEAGPFSWRIHDRHAQIAGPSGAIATCYKCHPGPNTQCLRDIMGKNPVNPLVCQNCHGTMDTVANSVLAGRRPWLDEPKCGGCHGSNHAEETGKLYRQSTGHGGLMCSACHGSPHAIQPTIQPNDNLQNTRLQGFAGTLQKCSVCHWMHQSAPGPHGIMDTSVVTPPEMPVQVSPSNGITGITAQPTLHWQTAAGASGYQVEVGSDALFGVIVWSDTAIGAAWIQLPVLPGGSTYYWHVRSKNSAGTSGWSAPWSFTTATGTTALYSVRKSWNLVSVPMVADNPRAAMLFPSALGAAYEFTPASGYATRDSLTPGIGYWLRFDRDQTVALTGVPVTAETIAVEAGWNLVGSVSNPLVWVSVGSVPAGIISSVPYAYEGSYIVADSLLPARGYWVKVSASGSLVLSSLAMAGPATQYGVGTTGVGTIGDQPSAAFTALTITDAAGRSGKLLVAGNHVGAGILSRYEMPPLPPSGAFDVRFDSHTMLASPGDRSSGRAGILIASPRYPLTVGWEASSVPGTLSLDVGGHLIPMDAPGNVSVPSPAAISVVGQPASRQVPDGYALEQNVPNPFNPSTTITYTVPTESRVNLSVYNMLGALVVKLVDQVRPAGTYTARWEPGDQPAGVYFCRIEASDASDPSKAVRLTKKMLYLK